MHRTRKTKTFLFSWLKVILFETTLINVIKKRNYRITQRSNYYIKNSAILSPDFSFSFDETKGTGNVASACGIACGVRKSWKKSVKNATSLQGLLLTPQCAVIRIGYVCCEWIIDAFHEGRRMSVQPFPPLLTMKSLFDLRICEQASGDSVVY